MLERLDNNAKLALVAAVEQARWFRHTFIGTEHLLRALAELS